MFSWVEKYQIKVKTWGIIHIPNFSHKCVSRVSHITICAKYRDDKWLFLIIFWGLRLFYLTMMYGTVHCITWPKKENSDDIGNQKECLGLLSTSNSLFIWRFFHDCVLNQLWTWINCCNMAKGFWVRRYGFNFLQTAN